MKQKFTAPMLVPKYVSQFQCIGGDCPDTCCMGWNISVDKQTFHDYRRVIHPAIKPLIKKHLVQLDKTSDGNHGKFHLKTPESHCGMQSADGLCGIQQNLGEAALSDTCYIYPRTVHRVQDRYEQCLTLSCPEAARLALTSDDAFEFVTAEFTSRQATTAALPAVHGFDPIAMDEVRFLCIQLFQTDALTISDRFVLMGWLCSELDRLITAGAQSKAIEVVQQVQDMVETGAYKNVVAELSSQPVLGARVFSILFGNPAGKGSSKNQKEVINWVSTGLGFGTTSAMPLTANELEKNYLRGLNLLNQNSELVEQIFSRYLLNDLLREMFPWGRLNPLGHYRHLLTRFGILRLMACAVAASKNEVLDKDSLVQVTQVFCRLYQHNDKFATHADSLLTGASWDKLEHLYALI